MANENSDFTQQDLFVDESGLTSLEPEGPHHHSHGAGWRPAPEIHAYDRWEGSTHSDSLAERGRRPVEGDGDGAPE
jgi:hypothetical protein